MQHRSFSNLGLGHDPRDDTLREALQANNSLPWCTVHGQTLIPGPTLFLSLHTPQCCRASSACVRPYCKPPRNAEQRLCPVLNALLDIPGLSHSVNFVSKPWRLPSPSLHSLSSQADPPYPHKENCFPLSSSLSLKARLFPVLRPEAQRVPPLFEKCSLKSRK